MAFFSCSTIPGLCPNGGQGGEGMVSLRGLRARSRARTPLAPRLLLKPQKETDHSVDSRSMSELI